MPKIPVENKTAMPIYVGADMIPPGEIRHFEEDQVPEHLRPAPEPAAEPAPESPEDPMEALSKQPAKDVIAALEGLTDEQLEQIGDIEQAKGDKARSTVLAAIAELTLKRAETQ